MPEPVRTLRTALGIHLAIGLAGYAHFLLTGSYSALDWYFKHPGTVFLVGMAAAGSVTSWMARSQFERNEPMHAVWTLIFLAAVFRMCGSILAEVAGRYSEAAHSAGLVIGSPVAMITLACGLARAIGLQRRFHLLGRPHPWDILLISAISCVTIRQVIEIGSLLVVHHFRPGAAQALLWLSDPLLTLLLIQAVLIRRSVLNMGHGLVAKCWGTIALAIAFTSAGDAALWITGLGIVPEWLVPLGWYLWFPAAALFAEAPGYQLAASRSAAEPCWQAEPGNDSARRWVEPWAAASAPAALPREKRPSGK